MVGCDVARQLGGRTVASKLKDHVSRARVDLESNGEIGLKLMQPRQQLSAQGLIICSHHKRDHAIVTRKRVERRENPAFHVQDGHRLQQSVDRFAPGHRVCLSVEGVARL